MKKIIELADIYSESVKNNESVFLQVKKKKELLVAIREYHTLQAIPITEDWLKEHGFEFNTEHISQPYIKEMKDWYISFVADINLLSVEKYKDRYVVCRMQKRDATLADLYDALDLCGIKID